MTSDLDIMNALEEAMQLYDACMAEPEPLKNLAQLAAFGVAVGFVADVLGMSIISSAVLVEVELVKRRKA